VVVMTVAAMRRVLLPLLPLILMLVPVMLARYVAVFLIIL
jgi:hypothetical protein